MVSNSVVINFRKIISNVSATPLERIPKSFFKCYSKHIWVNGFRDHNSAKISEQQKNRQKLNYNLKRNPFEDMFTRPSKIII